jgi:hypothetical protein
MHQKDRLSNRVNSKKMSKCNSNVGHWFVSCGFRWSAPYVGPLTNHNAIEQIKEQKNNKRKERDQIIYTLVCCIPSNSQTPTILYYVSWMSI